MDLGYDFRLLDSPEDETFVHRQASLHDDGHPKVNWSYGILIQKENMYLSKYASTRLGPLRAGKRCPDMDPSDHAALERERGDAGVLLIVAALAFRLGGGLLASRNRS